MSQEQPPFGLPGPVLAGIQRRPDPGLSLIAQRCAPPLYLYVVRGAVKIVLEDVLRVRMVYVAIYLNIDYASG